MRTLSQFLALFALLAAPAAAQGYLAPLDPNQSVTLTFVNYNLASAGLGADGTRKLIDEFMALHPNVTIEGIGVPSNEVMSRLQADFAARRAPDLVQLVFDGLDFAVTSFGVRPLEELVPPEELAAHFEGFYPRGLDLGRLDGRTYGLPYVFSTPVLWYNADLFAAAGLDPEKPPTTWDEARDAAAAIQAATDAVGINVAVFGTFDWMFQSLVLSNGGRVLSEDRSQLTFDGEGALGAVEMLRGLHEAGVKPDLSFAEAIEAFAAGRMGMYLQTSAVQGFLINSANGVFDLRAARMPAFGDQPTQPVNSGSALIILTTDPVKQRAAWEFMKFATSERGYTIITSEIGYLPLRPSIVDDPEFLGPWVAANPIVLPNLEQLESLAPWVPFPGPNYRQMVTIMMNALEEAVFGDGDARTTILDAHERAAPLMPR